MRAILHLTAALAAASGVAACGAEPGAEPPADARPSPQHPDARPEPPAPVDRDGDGVVDDADCAADDASRWERGPAWVDGDGDGVGGAATSGCRGAVAAPAGLVLVGGDCDDASPARYALRPYRFRDGDGDGRYVPLAGEICAGLDLPVGYAADDPDGDHDCDDSDVLRFRTAALFADRDGDRVGVAPAVEVCAGADMPSGWAAVDGDCAADSAAAWRLLPFTHRDVDGDQRYVAVGGTVCAGASLPSGYLPDDPGTEADCAPTDAAAWQRLPFTHRDTDGDRRYVASGGTVCAGASLPSGYLPADPGTEADCAPTDGARWQRRDAFVDADRDGVGVAPAQSQCIGDGLPAGWVTVAGDCADDDRARWQLLPYTHRDRDRDGITVSSGGTVCTGAALPAGYLTAGNGADCDDGDAARWEPVDLYADRDGDRFGAGAATASCVGASLPGGMSTVGTDCADDDRARWQELPYGFVDRDRDGHTVREEGRACSGAVLVAPYAAIPRGDDCDDASGAAHTLRPFAFRDADGDRRYVAAGGDLCAGDALPAGYAAADPGGARDCDDGDAARFRVASLFADTDTDGFGVAPAVEQCVGAAIPAGWATFDGDCAPDLAAAWQLVPYTHRDVDGDRRYVPEVGTVCTHAVLPAGYLGHDPGTEIDCAPDDAGAWQRRDAYPDTDGDRVGVAPARSVCVGDALPAGTVAVAGDCEPDDAARWQLRSYGHRDRDGDTFTVVEAGAVCAGAALPGGYLLTASGADCDDADSSRWRGLDLYADGDGDRVGAGAPTASCIGASIPDGMASAGTDCADDDRARWQQLRYAHVDRDGDGATAAESGRVCSGFGLARPFYSVPIGDDCDDRDAGRWRFRVLYPDGDGDGVGTRPYDVHCTGAGLPAGWSRGGWDVDDGDADVVEDEDELLELLLF